MLYVLMKENCHFSYSLSQGCMLCLSGFQTFSPKYYLKELILPKYPHYLGSAKYNAKVSKTTPGANIK